MEEIKGKKEVKEETKIAVEKKKKERKMKIIFEGREKIIGKTGKKRRNKIEDTIKKYKEDDEGGTD